MVMQLKSMIFSVLLISASVGLAERAHAYFFYWGGDTIEKIALDLNRSRLGLERDELDRIYGNIDE